MNISLTAELENLVSGKVASGMYQSASEVIHEGLRLLKERDELRRIRLDELRGDVIVGREQAERGESFPLDINAVVEQGRQRLAARRDE